MKARARFYARGQSDAARGVAYIPQRLLIATWPEWAQDAYRAGRLSVVGPGRTQEISDFIARARERVESAADAQIKSGKSP